jgi:hypothetical protein
MNGIGTTTPLQNWFDFKIPHPTVAPHAIQQYLYDTAERQPKNNHIMIWLGTQPTVSSIMLKKKNKTTTQSCLSFHTHTDSVNLILERPQIDFLHTYFTKLFISSQMPVLWQQFKADYEEALGHDVMLLWQHPEWQKIRTLGLLLV